MTGCAVDVQVPERAGRRDGCGMPQREVAGSFPAGRRQAVDASVLELPISRFSSGRRRLGSSLALGLCALVLVIAASGCSKVAARLPGHAKPAGQSAAKAQQLAAAKAAAAAALADVEECESAVLAGTTQEELSPKAAHAQATVEAFSSSDSGRLLPAVTSAIVLAERDYVDACKVWRANEAAAQAKLRTAPGPDATARLENARRPELYQSLWVKASTDLGLARTALEDATP